jgi:HlyD family secretion protein
MKRILMLAAALLVAACQPFENSIHGYVEGEFVLIAPTSGGVLETLSVERGQTVDAGDALFSLDLTDLRAQRESAVADIRRAQAELDDLLKGERPEEIEVILKQKEQAQARLTNAQKEYKRVLPLSKTGAASISARDEAKAELDSAKARMAELEAQLKTANLGARVDKVAAAQAMVDSAQQTLGRIEKKIEEAAPPAPTAGTIEDTLYRPGEYVAPGQPVINLLPPENVKARFYIPQETVPKLTLGQKVTISCDGCVGPIAAKISYIAPESEFTPPVIYSVESRDKLVFMIEAAPDTFHSELRPGLPVDIDLGL